MAQTQERASAIDETTLFFGLELLDIADEDIEKILAAPGSRAFKHYIRRRRLLKDHKLTEKEEKLLSKTNLTGHSAWTRMFHEIVDHQKFFLEGSDEPMGFSQVSTLLYDADRKKREGAALAITRGLEAPPAPANLPSSTRSCSTRKSATISGALKPRWTRATSPTRRT